MELAQSGLTDAHNLTQVVDVACVGEAAAQRAKVAYGRGRGRKTGRKLLDTIMAS